jgi:predicted nucleotidyltransferase
MSIQTIISSLKSFDPDKIILFGSHASGTANSSSDYDIAIIKDTDELYHDRVIAAHRLLRTTSPVDLFVFTPKEMNMYKNSNPFIANILATGKVIYG